MSLAQRQFFSHRRVVRGGKTGRAQGFVALLLASVLLAACSFPQDSGIKTRPQGLEVTPISIDTGADVASASSSWSMASYPNNAGSGIGREFTLVSAIISEGGLPPELVLWRGYGQDVQREDGAPKPEGNLSDAHLAVLIDDLGQEVPALVGNTLNKEGKASGYLYTRASMGTQTQGDALWVDQHWDTERYGEFVGVHNQNILVTQTRQGTVHVWEPSFKAGEALSEVVAIPAALTGSSSVTLDARVVHAGDEGRAVILFAGMRRDEAKSGYGLLTCPFKKGEAAKTSDCHMSSLIPRGAFGTPTHIIDLSPGAVLEAKRWGVFGTQVVKGESTPVLWALDSQGTAWMVHRANTQAFEQANIGRVLEGVNQEVGVFDGEAFTWDGYSHITRLSFDQNVAGEGQLHREIVVAWNPLNTKPIGVLAGASGSHLLTLEGGGGRLWYIGADPQYVGATDVPAVELLPGRNTAASVVDSRILGLQGRILFNEHGYQVLNVEGIPTLQLSTTAQPTAIVDGRLVSEAWLPTGAREPSRYAASYGDGWLIAEAGEEGELEGTHVWFRRPSGEWNVVDAVPKDALALGVLGRAGDGWIVTYTSSAVTAQRTTVVEDSGGKSAQGAGGELLAQDGDESRGDEEAQQGQEVQDTVWVSHSLDGIAWKRYSILAKKDSRIAVNAVCGLPDGQAIVVGMKETGGQTSGVVWKRDENDHWEETVLDTVDSVESCTTGHNVTLLTTRRGSQIAFFSGVDGNNWAWAAAEDRNANATFTSPQAVVGGGFVAVGARKSGGVNQVGLLLSKAGRAWSFVPLTLPTQVDRFDQALLLTDREGGAVLAARRHGQWQLVKIDGIPQLIQRL
ncbi:MAG: hypothetical protein Q4G30_02145 [Actinomycetaceae bacterium]|nr:hypothetical protein [Actinomycetaceae bacterium]